MLKQFKRFRFLALRNGEHLQLQREVQSLIASNPEAAGLLPPPVMARYSAAVMYEEESFAPPRRSRFMQALEELDRERDMIFRGMVHIVKGMAGHFEAAKREASRRVMMVLESCGNVPKLSHTSESSALEKLEELLEASPEMRGYVEELGLVPWLDKLVEANAAYGDLQQERVRESAVRAGRNMLRARAETDRAFRLLLNYMEVLLNTAPAEAPETLADELRVILRKYERMSHHRHSEGEEEEN